MITFRHGASEFKNLTLEYSGDSYYAVSVAAQAVFNAALKAIQLRNPPRLDIKHGVNYTRIKCEYNQHTAEVALTAICGFEWLAKQCPDEVKVERISNRKV